MKVRRSSSRVGPPEDHVLEYRTISLPRLSLVSAETVKRPSYDERRSIPIMCCKESKGATVYCQWKYSCAETRLRGALWNENLFARRVGCFDMFWFCLHETWRMQEFETCRRSRPQSLQYWRDSILLMHPSVPEHPGPWSNPTAAFKMIPCRQMQMLQLWATLSISISISLAGCPGCCPCLQDSKVRQLYSVTVDWCLSHGRRLVG